MTRRYPRRFEQGRLVVVTGRRAAQPIGRPWCAANGTVIAGEPVRFHGVVARIVVRGVVRDALDDELVDAVGVRGTSAAVWQRSTS